MITAFSSVVNLPPGRYNLMAVLNGIEGKQPSGYHWIMKKPKKPRKPKIYRYVKKADRLRILDEYLASCPDNDSELLTRPNIPTGYTNWYIS